MTDQRMNFGDEVVDGKIAVHSLSGKERNHFFLNLNEGESFADLSAISGLDSVADGRGLAILDYDHDGWQDVAVVNANSPLMQLYHNEIGQVPGVKGGIIALRFVGGNSTGNAAPGLSNRDGYGASVEVALSGGVLLKREHRCGEGFASQKSTTMLIGIGDRSGVESVSVRWPSGETDRLENVDEGTLVTVYESRAAGAFVRSPYRNAGERRERVGLEEKRFPLSRSAPERLQIYTTTATWCAACMHHLPALARLKQEGVALYGVPIDVEDNKAKLMDYVAMKQPPYEMMLELGVEQKESVSAFLSEELLMRVPVLPSSVITDGEGNVLEVLPGIPSLSKVRRWLMELDPPF